VPEHAHVALKRSLLQTAFAMLLLRSLALTFPCDREKRHKDNMEKKQQEAERKPAPGAAPSAQAAMPLSAISMDTGTSTPSSSAAGPASTGSPTVEYHDCFLGKVLVIPVAQRHQLDAPLIFVKAWLRLSRGRRAALGTALPRPLPPVGRTQFALWPAQRVRGMPELTATACHRLSAAPASLSVYFRVASGLRTLILDRVVSGYINKIQRTRDGAYETVIFNGHVYKSLGNHDPRSRQDIDERSKLYDLDPAWHICSPTPDALHVCATYPWAACALVFADGSAHATALGPMFHSSWTPGAPPHAAT
jgi:hypothetical protein